MNKDIGLSSTDKSVFMDLIYNKEKTKDVADKYNLSVIEVNNIKKKILEKFKTILHDNYGINSYADVAY